MKNELPGMDKTVSFDEDEQILETPEAQQTKKTEAPAPEKLFDDVSRMARQDMIKVLSGVLGASSKGGFTGKQSLKSTEALMHYIRKLEEQLENSNLALNNMARAMGDIIKHITIKDIENRARHETLAEVLKSKELTTPEELQKLHEEVMTPKFLPEDQRKAYKEMLAKTREANAQAQQSTPPDSKSEI